jgi:hypothetical protein
MKLYLKSIVNQLQNFSATLDKSSILIDKPWALIDEEFELQKLIFKKNKELIISKNGQVQVGKWDYFAEAKSLLIDRNVDKILCNEAFIDKGVLILKLDGTENRFFMLANENIIPDLNIDFYLKNLRYQKLIILESILADGRILEIQRDSLYDINAKVGNLVTINSEIIDDGKYFSVNKEYIEIKKGRIHKIFVETTYTNPDKQEITIIQQHSWLISKGDCVFLYGKQVDDAILNFSKSRNLIVKNGMVVKLERKLAVLRLISKGFKNLFSNN